MLPLSKPQRENHLASLLEETLKPLESKLYLGGKLAASPSEETLVPLQLNSPQGAAPPVSPSDTLVPLNQNLQPSHGLGIKFKPGYDITSGTVQSSNLCTETTTPISIFCVNCAVKSKDNQEEYRFWSGLIPGKRTLGYLKAYLIRIKLKVSKAPLIKLLTLCKECCLELGLNTHLAQMDRILKFKDTPNTHRKLVFRISHREIEEMFSSRVIILVGMFTTPFLTINPDGQWKEWNII